MKKSFLLMLLVLINVSLDMYPAFAPPFKSELQRLQGEMVMSVARRDIDKFLAYSQELQAHALSPSQYTFANGQNLLHFLMLGTRLPHDKATQTMLKTLLAADISPIQKDGLGRSPIDIAFAKFRQEPTYVTDMIAYLPAAERETFIRTASPSLQAHLTSAKLFKPVGIPDLKSGRSSASPLGFFESKQGANPEDLLSADLTEALIQVKDLLEVGRTERLKLLLSNTKKINPAYVVMVLSARIKDEDGVIQPLFDMLLYNFQQPILNWILNEADFTHEQRAELLLSSCILPDGVKTPLLPLPLLNQKFEAVYWLLNEAGLTPEEKSLILEQKTIHPAPGSIETSLLYQILFLGKGHVANWLLNEAGLTPEEKSLILEQRTTMANGAEQTTISLLLNRKQFAAAYWLLNEAGLTPEERDRLLMQRIYDHNGETESLIFNLLLNQSFDAVRWLFTKAELSPDLLAQLIREIPTESSDESLEATLSDYDAQEALDFLVGEETPLTMEQKILVSRAFTAEETTKDKADNSLDQ